MKKTYLKKRVDVALKERVSWIFDTFDNVIVSTSGGKDSSVCFDAILTEAEKRQREFYCFFLDREAEYSNTIETVRKQMHASSLVIPMWYQIEMSIFSPTEIIDRPFIAWDEGNKKRWMRKKEKISIKKIESDHPVQFYEFLYWIAQAWNDKTCFVIGMRSDESLERYMAVTKYPAVDGKKWTSKSAGKPINVYPIYDFTFTDVWKYLYDKKVYYNKIYDFMWGKNFNKQQMRVSSLINLYGYKSLTTLAEFEPTTYQKLLSRGIGGIATSELYAKEDTIFSNKNLPKAYSTWLGYRDYLLQNSNFNVDKFIKVFASQPKNEYHYKKQVKALLVNHIAPATRLVTYTKKDISISNKWEDLL